MSTADQSHAAALHGEALLQAQRSELHALIAHLEALANGHDDTRVEVAGTRPTHYEVKAVRSLHTVKAWRHLLRFQE